MPAQTFVHEFVSPINRYKALAVRHGLNVYAIVSYEGRQCYVTGSTRVLQRGRCYHNRLSVHFLDDGSTQSIPAGRFSSKAKSVPIPA
jgi:hypothetical protein